MVILENKDTHIFNLPEKIVDIVHEYTNTGKVIITTNSEGLCLLSANFYNTLDYVCSKFQISKKSIIIKTCNVEEFHPEYTIKILDNYYIDSCKPYLKVKLLQKNHQLHTVGCFIGKPNWHRLIISAWLYTNFNNKILLTCHYNPQDERHLIDSELTMLNQLAFNELSTVIPYMKKCPVYLDEGFLDYTIGPPTHYNLLQKYTDIFLDLVVETYVTGKTFFPTEKTLRPIIAKTPFIIMGPQGYLSNLRRIGYKTFSNWWSEDYDNFNGYQRILEIKKILENVFTWPHSKLNDTLNEMNNVLDHNRTVLQYMKGSEVKLS